MTLVDLSVPLRTGMPVYPGDPEVSIAPALTIAACGVEVHTLALGSHSGTHLDAPSHTVAGGRTVDDIALEHLVGPTLVLDARGPGTVDLPDEVPARVFLCTGWDEHWGTARMTEHPGQPVELVDRLWDRGMRLLGVDCLSPDPTPSEDLPVHAAVLGRDGLIVENLRGLAPLVGRTVEATMMPLALHGVDGSPVRAWARV